MIGAFASRASFEMKMANPINEPKKKRMGQAADRLPAMRDESRIPARYSTRIAPLGPIAVSTETSSFSVTVAPDLSVN